MREPYGENRFDLILNLFTSFGYFDHYEDNLRACHQAKKALKPGGLLVIDFLNLAAVLANLVKEETIIIEGHHFRIERSVHNGQILKKIHLKEPDGTEHFFKEEVQALSIDDFKELFRQSGISLLDTFGSYKLANFDPLHSERLILLAQA
jgi:SAM-dependent methyltransferase